jgi:hypothetical protein
MDGRIEVFRAGRRVSTRWSAGVYRFGFSATAVGLSVIASAAAAVSAG